MTTSQRAHTWQDIQDRIRANIQQRVWLPGELIPGEVALAEQFGCARTTVNRALRELASTGIIDRKRKAGTRVALQPIRRVSASIPVIRTQVEAQQLSYSFKLIKYQLVVPPDNIKQLLQIKANCKSLHVHTVHFSDNAPFIYEDRWVNTQTIGDIKKVDLNEISANEWLVQHVPFTKGEFVVEACLAKASVAKALQVDVKTPLLRSTRTTWLEKESVTMVKLHYLPGHQMRFEI